ncbi:MAG: hypothetical protein M3486_08315 [Actinomycetota bacterium]|nr:hypothetical protein [Actinomycetota bacterium]
MAVSADLSKYLDKAYESKGLDGVLATPVSALAGVTDDDGEHLRAAFDSTTVADLGKNKYFTAAQAMLALTK